jgi:membrane protease YdiL (CAAX protease family)
MTTAATPRSIAPALVTFLVLGCLLSWYPWVLHLMGRPGNGGPNPLGLLVAALVAAAVAGGWRGPVEVLKGIVRLAAPARVWFAALLLPFAALAVAAAIAEAAGVPLASRPPDASDLFDRFVFALLFVGLGEEPAWRGFLLPLLRRRFAPVMATLILFAVWAAWHLPLMGGEFAWTVVPFFLLSLAGAAFVLSWMYNASRSVLPGMIMHALINTAAAGYVFTLVARADLVRFWTIYGLVWLGIGLLAIALTRGKLA